MKKHIAGVAVALFAILPALALAHGHGHIMGTITNVAADHLEVKSGDGKAVSVPLTQDTKYFKGAKDEPATAADAKTGLRVVVHLGKDKAALEVHLAVN